MLVPVKGRGGSSPPSDTKSRDASRAYEHEQANHGEPPPGVYPDQRPVALLSGLGLPAPIPAENTFEKVPQKSESRGPIGTVPNVFQTNQAPAGFLSRELGLEVIEPVSAASEQCSAAVVRPDSSWRLINAELFSALGWVPGTRLAFQRTTSGYALHIVGAQYTGASARVDRRQRLGLPRNVRQTLGLTPGQTLIVLADTRTGTATLATVSTVHNALQESA